MRSLTLAALLGLSLSGCYLLAGEAACERDRDCPDSVAFCSATDGGVGRCVEEDPSPDPPPIDDAGFDIPILDAGPGPQDADAG